MRKKVLLIIYALMEYYSSSKSKKQIAYESALVAVVMIIYLNVEFVNLLIPILPGGIFDVNSNNHTSVVLKIIAVLFPMYLIIKFFFKKEELLKLQYDEDIISKVQANVTIYGIISFCAVMVTAIFNKYYR